MEAAAARRRGLRRAPGATTPRAGRAARCHALHELGAGAEPPAIGALDARRDHAHVARAPARRARAPGPEQRRDRRPAGAQRPHRGVAPLPGHAEARGERPPRALSSELAAIRRRRASASRGTGATRPCRTESTRRSAICALERPCRASSTSCCSRRVSATSPLLQALDARAAARPRPGGAARRCARRPGGRSPRGPRGRRASRRPRPPRTRSAGRRSRRTCRPARARRVRRRPRAPRRARRRRPSSGASQRGGDLLERGGDAARRGADAHRVVRQLPRVDRRLGRLLRGVEQQSPARRSRRRRPSASTPRPA